MSPLTGVLMAIVRAGRGRGMAGLVLIVTTAAMQTWAAPKDPPRDAPGGRVPRAGVNPPAAMPDGGRGLLAELFDDETFEHKVKVRVDREVDFLFGNGTPDPELRADHFSIRWTGFLRAPRAMRCKFVAYVDDKVRVWLDGKVVIDKAGGRGEALVELSGKPQPLKVEYVEENSGAAVSLHWVVTGRPGQEEETVLPPEVLFRTAAAAARPGARAPAAQGHRAAG